ncbi:MAG TPA: multiheme c-type cytochrome [Bryobacteraceae bacterium]|nr:multiheme c-type cytochrome [Bryobacteraceae bacterium]
MKRAAFVAGLLVLALLLMIPGASLYYESGSGEACARCHEIRGSFENWQASTHRSVPCKGCHGDALTLDAEFHMTNLRRVSTHLRGDVPEQVRIRERDALRMLERCRNCHRQEFADWQAGPHGISYDRIFLDKEHNRKQLLMDDCLRCHGAWFEGSIRDLVTPIDSRGPWRLRDAGRRTLPVMPCMACHQMHRRGQPLARPPATLLPPGPNQELHRPSLALYDRRERTFVSTAALPMPAMREGPRRVKMSPDARQGICYQCHAPLASFQVNSGDDRTAIGVHEGLSCLACHLRHGQQTRASCATCHPRLSNCGLDVEKMDTTFKDKNSKHNIHFVKCADCHTKGVPKRRTPQAGAPVATRPLPATPPRAARKLPFAPASP